LLDVRTAESLPRSRAGFAHAPGGQLVQATDQWVGIKGARIVLADRRRCATGDRRLAAATRHEACVLQGGIAAAAI